MPAARCTTHLRLSLLRVAFAVAVAWPACGTKAGAADDVPTLVGTWKWSWKDPAGTTHQHLLQVEGVGAKLAARERFDDLDPIPVRDLQLVGKTVRFSVVRGDRRADYEGVMADRGTINGTVTVTVRDETSETPWEATRVEARKK